MQSDFNESALQSEQQTPQPGELANAAMRCSTEAVADLLRRGAEVDEHGMGGTTALMWAAHIGNKEMVVLLLEHGADTEVKNDNRNVARDFAELNNHVEVLQLLEIAPQIRQNFLDQRAADEKARLDNAARTERDRVLREETRDLLRGHAPKVTIKPAGGPHVSR